MGYGGGANVGPGFDEQDVEGPILGHPTGHNAARRAGADDNVGELVVHGTNAISDALVFFFVSSLGAISGVYIEYLNHEQLLIGLWVGT
jgi:hypothetical protein